MIDERSRQGRALFYHRDSGGKHEQSLPGYVEWAGRTTFDLKLRFDGTPERIMTMVKTKVPFSGDLFLDYSVKGHEMSRTALDRLHATMTSDPEVSHLLIAKRERLFRPDEPFDAVKWEESVRELGITIVYQDKVLPPLIPGQRRDVADRLSSYLEYEKTGRFRTELASKMIYSHANLAKQGFSTGGRASYGFRRWLVDPMGNPIRELGAGEVVRLAGHHVALRPGPEQELKVIHRILTLLPTTPATQIAKMFNAEGIPAPDTGRTRTDHGVTHVVSGLWHSTTIINIARRSLVVAETSYGQRSMGDQLRHSPTGPRPLVRADRRADGKPKVIQNPEDTIIRGPANFPPLMEPGEHEQLISILDRRAGTQRGKPRSREPGRNPLGCRVFDLACSGLMYRTPYNGTFRYVCGLYQQSHGQRCSHNHVDGVTATRFALAAVQQQVCTPQARKGLEDRLRKRALAEAKAPAVSGELQTKTAELARINKSLDQAGRNLAMAQNDMQFQAIAKVMSEFQLVKKACEAEIATLEKQTKARKSVEEEVAAMMLSIERIYDLAKDSSNMPAIGELFKRLNLNLFLRFLPVQKAKRIENKLVGGVLTMGAAQLPIEPYSGPTGRSALKLQRKNAAGLDPAADTEPNCSGLEAESLGNVNRDDARLVKPDLGQILDGIGRFDDAMLSLGAIHRDPAPIGNFQ